MELCYKGNWSTGRIANKEGAVSSHGENFVTLVDQNMAVYLPDYEIPF